MDTESYWAALEDPAEFGAKLKAVIEDGDSSSVTQTVLDEQRNAYLHLFSIPLAGGTSSSSRIMHDGQEGELATFRVPLAAALASAVVNLITNQKITWQCQAPNADAASRAQTTLGNQAVEFYWHDRGGEKAARQLAEQGVPFGEAFLFVEYDPMAGEVASVAPGAEGAVVPEYEGDIRYNVVSSWDVKRDPRSRSPDECDWYAFRLRRNKWDLVVRFGPDVLEACSSASKGILPSRNEGANDKVQSELVDCWYWFHRPTPSMPHGGQAVLVGDKVFARDELRYWKPSGERCMPLTRFHTGNLVGTPFPFAPFWTALASQELQDSVLSAIATNNLAFAHQMIAVPAGAELEPESFGPARMLTVPPGGFEPKAVQLTQSPPEAFKLLEKLQVDQRQLLGLNGTALGQPEGANLSGAAMALLSSMAIQANSSPQANWVSAVEEAGQITVGIFQRHFTAERKIRIAGKGMGYMAREAALSGEAVQGLNTVSVRVGNPLSQTILGREQIFDKIIKLQAASGGTTQLIKTVEDVQQLFDVGRLEGLTDTSRDQAILVEAENEALARGEPVVALLGDDDVYHCKHHRSVAVSLEARKNEALLHNALDHIHQHYLNAFGIDPLQDQAMMPDAYRHNMMALMGVAPPPMPAAMPGSPPAGDGAPPPPGAEAPMPRMPTNPATGDEFDAQTGGGVVPSPTGE